MLGEFPGTGSDCARHVDRGGMSSMWTGSELLAIWQSFPWDAVAQVEVSTCSTLTQECPV